MERTNPTNDGSFFLARKEDGSQKDSITLTGYIGSAASQSLTLGVKSYTDSLYGNMLMSNFLFENGVAWDILTIISKMNNTPVGGTVSASLGDGSGTTATDTSGNGNSGTITNGSWSTDTPSKLRLPAVNRNTITVPRTLAVNRTMVT